MRPGVLSKLFRRFKSSVIPVRQNLLSGTCSRCGLCCEADGFRCLNLRGPSILSRIQAGPTTCAVYDQRYDGMPILLMDSEGHVADGECGKDSLGEDMTIIEAGIDKGCSLELKEEQPLFKFETIEHG